MTQYTDKITSEHAKAAKFVAKVGISTNPFIAVQSALAAMPAGFDLDQAIGAQLDAVGLWIGVSRRVSVPIAGVYFSWDTPGLGWDQGVWKGRFDPSDGLTVLPDESYRLLLKAKIAANHWDGTLPGAAFAYSVLFPDNVVVVDDNQDMTMTISITGPPITPLQEALLTGGYLTLKPVGVGVNYVV